MIRSMMTSHFNCYLEGDMTPEEVRTAIILCKRAPLKGEEALNAARSILALERLYEELTTGVENDDTGTDQ